MIPSRLQKNKALFNDMSCLYCSLGSNAYANMFYVA